MRNSNSLPYLIFELANVHSGEVTELFKLIDAYRSVDFPLKGIKFQPFKADEIALPDYSWYPTYEKLYFDQETWSQAIETADRYGDVWLDLFDSYGVNIFEQNKPRIVGLKLQASVLDNAELTDAVLKSGIEAQKLIINISGYEISEIERYISEFKRAGIGQLILQVGFQAYPTSISHTALQKIAVLRAAFPDVAICLADHSAAEDEVARHIPVWGVAHGCTYIEKHFCLDRSQAQFDHFSALQPQEFVEMLEYLLAYHQASSGSFISDVEAKYLKNSYQAPIVKKDVPRGRLISIDDLVFKRTNQSGLTLREIHNEQLGFSILGDRISQGSTLSKRNYKQASIGVIVACRMKSSRLAEKAILPVNGVPSIERCLHNCLQISSASQVILATSTLEQDAVLKNHLLEGKVKFWQGETNDVIKRYLGACRFYGVDVIVRVTADCPVISHEITEFLLYSHFENGADYTAAKDFAVGSSPEIYNVEALSRVIELHGSADYSEYMTWYMRNNPEIFKVNLVDLPSEYIRDYRLTLDYHEDLEMFNRLYAALEEQKLEPTITNVFRIMDEDESIVNINKHLTLSYKTDATLIDKLNKLTKITLRI